jgi:hypothetical protein
MGHTGFVAEDWRQREKAREKAGSILKWWVEPEIREATNDEKWIGTDGGNWSDGKGEKSAGKFSVTFRAPASGHAANDRTYSITAEIQVTDNHNQPLTVVLTCSASGGRICKRGEAPVGIPRVGLPRLSKQFSIDEDGSNIAQWLREQLTAFCEESKKVEAEPR